MRRSQSMRRPFVFVAIKYVALRSCGVGLTTEQLSSRDPRLLRLPAAARPTTDAPAHPDTSPRAHGS